MNINQTPLSYVTPGKYTFKGDKNVPIKGVEAKRQITATFGISLTGAFLPMQLIYAGKTRRCLPKFTFPDEFHVTSTVNHWSNTEKSIEFFNEIIFPYLTKVKSQNGFPDEQFSLVIMDTFNGQDNKAIKTLCLEHYCGSPHNLTHKFQPLDLTVNKSVKSSIQNMYNKWFSDQVAIQPLKGIAPADMNVSLKISHIKPMHARWIKVLYDYLRGEPEMIINGFDAA